MTSYLLDSYAWLEYFDGSDAGKKVEKLLNSSECFTSSLSIAEVTIKLLKNNRDAQAGLQIMKQSSKELLVDHDTAFEAANLYVEKRKTIKDIGIVDVIIMTQARQNALIVITGDREHFKDEKYVVLL
jgi:predicted nucleic acid-binding protein